MPDGVSAVGRLAPGGAWIGFAPAAGGYRLALGGDPAGGDLAEPDSDRERRADLVAVASAYVEGSFDDPPPELEATMHDIGDLVRWLTDTEPDVRVRRLLQEALDGIDDGVAADLLVTRLSAAQLALDPAAGADPGERLRSRYRSRRR